MTRVTCRTRTAQFYSNEYFQYLQYRYLLQEYRKWSDHDGPEFITKFLCNFEKIYFRMYYNNDNLT